MILWRREVPPDETPLNLNVSAMPIKIAPLERQQLAKPETRTQRRERPRVPLREVCGSRRNENRRLVPGERIDLRFRLVAAPQVLPKP
jgi:hypothetical protein